MVLDGETVDLLFVEGEAHRRSAMGGEEFVEVASAVAEAVPCFGECDAGHQDGRAGGDILRRAPLGIGFGNAVRTGDEVLGTGQPPPREQVLPDDTGSVDGFPALEQGV